jgi:hypothetical protein
MTASATPTWAQSVHTRAADPWVRLVVAIVALAVCLGVLPPRAHAETVPEYRALLVTALETATAAESAAPPTQADAIASISAALDGVAVVVLADGQPLRLENPPLRSALAEGDLDGARRHLAALIAVLDVVQDAAPPPPDAQARLAAVLARTEFRPPEPTWWERLTQPLRQMLERLLAPLGNALEYARRALLAWLQTAAPGGEGLVVVVVGLLVVLAVGALVAGAFGGAVAASARAAAPLLARGPTAAALRDQAYARASRGEYRAAVSLLYRATLLQLDEHGRLRYRPSLTNREHLALADLTSEVSAILRPLVERYDRLWYGGGRCDADAWARFVALAEPAWRLP